MRLFLLLLVLAGAVCVSPAATTPALDGRTFVIELVEEPSGKAQGKDTLVFVEGFGDCRTAGKKYGYAKRRFHGSFLLRPALIGCGGVRRTIWCSTWPTAMPPLQTARLPCLARRWPGSLRNEP